MITNPMPISGMSKKFTVSAAQCPKCLAIVISSHRHDYHSCPCQEIAIDGGMDYTRMAFKKKVPVIFPLDYVGGVTKRQLEMEVFAATNARWHNREHPDDIIPVPELILTTIRTTLQVHPRQYRYTVNSKGKLRRYPKKSS